MIIFEIILSVIVEDLIIGGIGFGLSKANNAILKLRGIETRTAKEIKMDRLKKRYVNKRVRLIKGVKNLKKGTEGVVLKLKDMGTATVEFKEYDNEVYNIRLRTLLVRADPNELPKEAQKLGE